MRKRSIRQLTGNVAGHTATDDPATPKQQRFLDRFNEISAECATMLVVVAFDNEDETTDTTTLVSGCPACRVANLEVLLQHLRESCPSIDFPSPRPKEGFELEHLH